MVLISLSLRPERHSDGSIVKRILTAQLLGNLNANIREERDEDFTDGYRHGDRNERGEKLVEWTRSHNMLIGNIYFQQLHRRLLIWKIQEINIASKSFTF